MKYLKICVCLTLLFSLLACNKQEQVDEELTKAELAKDSMALHVAVFPNEGSLPLYYAKEVGLLDSLGADIRLLHYKSMEDCDTALTFHRAEVAVTDIARLLCMRKDKFRATAIAQLPATASLLTAKSSRLNEVAQLKERIVAMDRHSETDYCTDKMLEGTSLDRLLVFRTQFNIHKLREEMLTGKLVDAAILDEPYATLAIELGAKCIWKRDIKEQPWSVLAIPTQLLNDKKRSEQVKVLLKVYQQAVEELQDTTKQLLVDEILKAYYDIPPAIIDTMPALRQSLKPQSLKPIKAETVDKARAWLIDREWISSSMPTDSITHNLVQE